MLWCSRQSMRAQSCSTLCDPMDCSPPGSSVHGISQGRILEWVAISSSRESLQPRDWTHISWVSLIDRQILYQWATWRATYSAGRCHLSYSNWPGSFRYKRLLCFLIPSSCWRIMVWFSLSNLVYWFHEFPGNFFINHLVFRLEFIFDWNQES